MLYCEKCSVTVTGKPDFCPLCQGNLDGVPEGGDIFPIIKEKPDKLLIAVRIIAFLSMVAVFICATINYLQLKSFNGWWLYVLAGVSSFWPPFLVSIWYRRNVTKSIGSAALFCCIIVFLWDLLIGYRGWSIDIVWPVVCCTAMLAMVVTAKILSFRIEQYIYYLIADIIFGIVPLILIFCGVIKFIYPSILCVAISAISFTALLIFSSKALLAEISRRTHV